jgi:hypothetical protein
MVVARTAFTATALVTLALALVQRRRVTPLMSAASAAEICGRILHAVRVPGQNEDPTLVLLTGSTSIAEFELISPTRLHRRRSYLSSVNLFDGAVTDRVRCELVSGNYFDVLAWCGSGRTWS